MWRIRGVSVAVDVALVCEGGCECSRGQCVILDIEDTFKAKKGASACHDAQSLAIGVLAHAKHTVDPDREDVTHLVQYAGGEIV